MTSPASSLIGAATNMVARPSTIAPRKSLKGTSEGWGRLMRVRPDLTLSRKPACFKSRLLTPILESRVEARLTSSRAMMKNPR